ncbi:MAG: DNA polymerase IV [Bacteroidia bacterium]|nr:DNA polymerase IV [Bacteroidia bacterium]
MTPIRKIIHVDMDAFFASVEQRDNPELRGKPVAVGGAGGRGVVAAASYEARKFGVRSAMPSKTALRLCPDLIFVKPHFDHYRAVSRQIREIFYSYTDLVEPLSLDEAYLDVTHNKQGLISASQVAKRVRQEIFDATALTASAGVSINKFLAKIASDMNKPDGLTIILPEHAEKFLEQLPIEKFHGIGEKTAEKMRKFGIRNGADLKAKSELELAHRFGKSGRYFYRIVRALDDRPVQPNRIRKSLGAEQTFFEDLATESDMLDQLQRITETVVQRLANAGTSGRTITLKIKYHDFEQTTRSKTVSQYCDKMEQIFPIIRELLHQPHFPQKTVRLLGVTLSNLDLEIETQSMQLTLDF